MGAATSIELDGTIGREGFEDRFQAHAGNTIVVTRVLAPGQRDGRLFARSVLDARGGRDTETIMPSRALYPLAPPNNMPSRALYPLAPPHSLHTRPQYAAGTESESSW